VTDKPSAAGEGSAPRSGEDALIARHFAPLATAAGALALTDDTAFYTPPPGFDLVLTKDAVAAGVHFLPDDSGATIARKALRVNLSDLAAKGAAPVGYLLALGLPDAWTEDWLAEFAAGLAGDQAAFGVSLYGGDTIRTVERTVVSITAFGLVPAGRMVRRGAAQAGDRILVTGTIGDAALGLKLRLDPDLAGRLGLAAGDAAHLLDRYAHPQPRVAAASAVRDHARAAMDVSDGLVGDLAKMAKTSGVAIRLEAARVPLSSAAAAAVAAEPRLLETALTGGDDYEIVAAVPPESVAAFLAGCAAAGVAATEIGTASEGAPGITVAGADGAVLPIGRGSFSHF
jgi:thiamine-monophosphate kinase